MNAGYDRSYHSVKVVRAEELRGERQPEFTPLDLETAFLQEVEIQDIVEGWSAQVGIDTNGIVVTLPFPRMALDHAMNFYGSVK
ncbi:amino acid--tRNA ligase-related protein, partial [Streptococcus suis]